MGATTTPHPQPIEHAKPLNWALAIVAGLLTAVFAVRGWLFSPLLVALFAALTAGIATLNLAPQERYLRRKQSGRTALRTSMAVIVGQFASLLWLLPAITEQNGAQLATITEGAVEPFVYTFLASILTLIVGLGTGRFGANQAARITPITLGLENQANAALHPDWIKERRPIPANIFSPGANHDFSWYFEGDLQVEIKSLDDIMSFLKECDYVSDNSLFMQRDFWQHPVTFEQIRKGDCEDSSLWAWRRLKELNYDAELVSGIFLKNGGFHAWVNVTIDGQPFVYETTRKRSYPLIPMTEAVSKYRPFVSVDHEYNTYRFAGADKPFVEKKDEAGPENE